VRTCVRGFEAEARARHVDLSARLDGDLPAVHAAPDQVQRVLQNLLTNALRHTPSDGAVAVVVRAGDREVTIAVEDNGEGLSGGAERRMFERFWQGDSARAAPRSGAGLGLAIARGLVEAQGGHIWAENRQGGGARVAFTLPRA
jgi:signal transduction histidine kinase